MMSPAAVATEFAGTTFFLAAILASGGMGLQFAVVGAALALAVYVGGSISGGHFNPAVSAMVLSRGGIDAATFAAYVVAQLAGGLTASALVRAALKK